MHCMMTQDNDYGMITSVNLLHLPPPTPTTQQLDGQMHSMMAQKKKRLEQIEADQKEIDAINHTIAVHITPNLVRLICVPNWVHADCMLCLTERMHLGPSCQTERMYAG